jgi:hypothetical protein
VVLIFVKGLENAFLDSYTRSPTCQKNPMITGLARVRFDFESSGASGNL